MKKDPYGVFEVVVPARNGQPAIAHNSKIKVWTPNQGLADANLLDLYDHSFRRKN